MKTNMMSDKPHPLHGHCKRTIIEMLRRDGSMTPLELRNATGCSRVHIGEILNNHPEFEKDPEIVFTGKGNTPTYWRLAGMPSRREPQNVTIVATPEPPLPAPMPVAVDPAVASMVNDQVAIARSIGVLARHGDAALTSAMLVRWQQKRAQIQRTLGIRVDHEDEEEDEHTRERNPKR
jgi:hypothetical protein